MKKSKLKVKKVLPQDMTTKDRDDKIESLIEELITYAHWIDPLDIANLLREFLYTRYPVNAYIQDEIFSAIIIGSKEDKEITCVTKKVYKGSKN